ncbi:PAS domain-containing protein [Alkalihalobacterium chitinilyticum]|uniref:Oxygen sensor histidine kinase NreB n=1 Tax=Alkalihalobacterium chitinilyticum TaxID=2980103 RepID=A0ABT5VJB4_9BACI|nr:PAS domain-containing protein [Alkalihalobacterium chitinilyticum]MDE5414807.1 PAS domain S-box protein [Alkalihalobacterium chitinilyticum]
MQIDQHIEDGSFRDDLKQSLKEMTDIRFALDESTIVAITNHKGQIKYVNDKFCEISKYNRDELIGQDHRIINSGYHDKAFMTNLWKTISSGKVWKGEIKNRAKDGSYYWVNTTIVPFLSSEGAPYQYLAIRNEVTQLKKAEEELKLMMNRVLEIQEEERKRFSRELHDGIGQSLFSLIIHMDRMMSEDNYSSMQTLRNEVSGIMEEIRSLAWDLRPSLLDDLGVVPAINRHIDKFSQYYGIDVEFTCDLRHRLDMQKETTIYRIIQESLTNIAKYANVSEAYLTLTETEDHVQATIKDEGKGFVRNNGKGVGLFSMEERARSVNGTFDILSAPGKGTTVTLVVPKA